MSKTTILISCGADETANLQAIRDWLKQKGEGESIGAIGPFHGVEIDAPLEQQFIDMAMELPWKERKGFGLVISDGTGDVRVVRLQGH